MDSTPPARPLNTLQTQTSGGSIMLQLHLSPRHSPRGPAPSRVSPIWTRGSTSKWSDARPSIHIPHPPATSRFLPAFPPQVWDSAMSGGVIPQLSVLLNGVWRCIRLPSPPSSSFILLGMSAIFNRYRYISPPPPLAFTASASIEEHIVLATRCNQFHSDTLWVVFLKCNSSFFRIRRGGTWTPSLWPDSRQTEKYKQD